MAALHPSTANEQAPRHPVRIGLTLQEPTDSTLYIAGSFSNPPWTPLPMLADHESSATPVASDGTIQTSANDTASSGVTKFQRQFDLPAGEYQYKFRIGEGNKWITDDKAATKIDEQGHLNNTLSVGPPSKLPRIDTSRSTRTPTNSRRRGSSAHHSPAVQQTFDRPIRSRNSNDFSDYDIPIEAFEGPDSTSSPLNISASVSLSRPQSRGTSATASPHTRSRRISFTKPKDLEESPRRVSFGSEQERTSRLEKFQAGPDQDKKVTATESSPVPSGLQAKIRKMMTPILEKPNQLEEVVVSSDSEADNMEDKIDTSYEKPVVAANTSAPARTPSSLLERRKQTKKGDSKSPENVIRSESDSSMNSETLRHDRVDSGYTSTDDLTARKDDLKDHGKAEPLLDRKDSELKLSPAAEIENHPSLNSPRQEICPLFEHESPIFDQEPRQQRTKMRTMSAMLRDEHRDLDDALHADEGKIDPDEKIAAMLDETKRSRSSGAMVPSSSPVSNLHTISPILSAGKDVTKSPSFAALQPITEAALADVKDDTENVNGSTEKPEDVLSTKAVRGSPVFLPLFDDKNKSQVNSPEIQSGRENATPTEELEELPLPAVGDLDLKVLSNQGRRGSIETTEKPASPVVTLPVSRDGFEEDGLRLRTKHPLDDATAKVIDFATTSATDDGPEAKRVKLSPTTPSQDTEKLKGPRPSKSMKLTRKTTFDHLAGSFEFFQAVLQLIGLLVVVYIALFNPEVVEALRDVADRIWEEVVALVLRGFR